MENPIILKRRKKVNKSKEELLMEERKRIDASIEANVHYQIGKAEAELLYQNEIYALREQVRYYRDLIARHNIKEYDAMERDFHATVGAFGRA